MLVQSTAAQHLLKFGLVLAFALEARRASLLIKLLGAFVKEAFILLVAAQAEVQNGSA